MADLRLRPLRLGDEDAALAAHHELADEDFPFLLGWDPERPWPEFVRWQAGMRRGEGLPPRWVPGTFLIAEVDGELVGRISIRHRLNDGLIQFGGHIGYAVRPARRRLGYGTEILRQGLIIVRAEGVDEVLVVCDDDNRGSAAIIERLGGILEDVRVGAEGRPMRRYWIR